MSFIHNHKNEKSTRDLPYIKHLSDLFHFDKFVVSFKVNS